MGIPSGRPTTDDHGERCGAREPIGSVTAPAALLSPRLQHHSSTRWQVGRQEGHFAHIIGMQDQVAGSGCVFSTIVDNCAHHGVRNYPLSCSPGRRVSAMPSLAGVAASPRCRIASRAWFCISLKVKTKAKAGCWAIWAYGIRVGRLAWLVGLLCGSGLVCLMTGAGSRGGRRSRGGGLWRACCLRPLGMCCGCLKLCGLLWLGGLILGCMRGGRWHMPTCPLRLGLRTLTWRCGGCLGRCRRTSGCAPSAWRLTGLTRGSRRCGVDTRTGSAMTRRLRTPCAGMTRSGIRGAWILAL